MNPLQKQIADLQRQIDEMKRATSQQNIKPDTIKQRHVGEGVRFVRSGLDVNLPATPETPQNGVAMYFATDTFKLYISTGSAWKSTTLS